MPKNEEQSKQKNQRQQSIVHIVMLILNMHRKISFVMVKEANKFHCFYGWKELIMYTF